MKQIGSISCTKPSDHLQTFINHLKNAGYRKNLNEIQVSCELTLKWNKIEAIPIRMITSEENWIILINWFWSTLTKVNEISARIVQHWNSWLIKNWRSNGSISCTKLSVSHLKKVGYKKNLNAWVSYELTLKWNEIEAIPIRIITIEENWIILINWFWSTVILTQAIQNYHNLYTEMMLCSINTTKYWNYETWKKY